MKKALPALAEKNVLREFWLLRPHNHNSFPSMRGITVRRSIRLVTNRKCFDQLVAAWLVHGPITASAIANKNEIGNQLHSIIGYLEEEDWSAPKFHSDSIWCENICTKAYSKALNPVFHA